MEVDEISVELFDQWLQGLLDGTARRRPGEMEHMFAENVLLALNKSGQSHVHLTADARVAAVDQVLDRRPPLQGRGPVLFLLELRGQLIQVQLVVNVAEHATGLFRVVQCCTQLQLFVEE